MYLYNINFTNTNLSNVSSGLLGVFVQTIITTVMGCGKCVKNEQIFHEFKRVDIPSRSHYINIGSKHTYICFHGVRNFHLFRFLHIRFDVFASNIHHPLTHPTSLFIHHIRFRDISSRKWCNWGWNALTRPLSHMLGFQRLDLETSLESDTRFYVVVICIRSVLINRFIFSQLQYTWYYCKAF